MKLTTMSSTIFNNYCCRTSSSAVLSCDGKDDTTVLDVQIRGTVLNGRHNNQPQGDREGGGRIREGLM